MTAALLLLVGLSLLYMAATSRLEAMVKALAFQGILLFLVALAAARHQDQFTLVLLALEALVAKGIIIPVFLLRIARRQGMRRDTEPFMPHFYALVAVTTLFAAGFASAYWAAHATAGVRPLVFGCAVFTSLTGLFFIMTLRKVISHVIGFVVLENGIFLLALAAESELPPAVSLGVLLDLFVAVFLFGLLARKIHDVFEGDEVAALSELRD